MKLSHRRGFLHLAAGAMTLPMASRFAGAQAYPSRPVRCVVGYPPGGGTDIFVRLVGQPLSSRLGQPFIIENRSGAASNIATELVVRASADGYTLLGVDSAAAINATLYPKLNFNFVRDIAVVAMTRGPLVMVVHLSVPAKTLPEFIAYAKGNPGKIHFGSAGTGAPTHMAGELFKLMAGVEIVHVPYRGAAPAITDLLGGQVQVMFAAAPPSAEHIRAGRLRALAVTTSTRWEALSDIPTVGDFLPGYEANQWWAIGLRKSAPSEIIEKLNKEIDAILADSKLRAQLAELGSTVFPGLPADFQKFVADDTEKWAKVVKLSGAKPE
jgi:tripartite-type tricarboxylate transporter receptor subunit TctC